jgi:hypothetical protein
MVSLPENSSLSLLRATLDIVGIGEDLAWRGMGGCAPSGWMVWWVECTMVVEGVMSA